MKDTNQTTKIQMTQKQRLETLRAFVRSLRRFCNTHSIHAFDALEKEIKRQEKDHRGFGSRFTDGRASYRQPVRVAVDYFVCQTMSNAFVVREFDTPSKVFNALAVRLDYLLAMSIVARYHDDLVGAGFTGKAFEDASELVDYAWDIASRD